MRKGIKRMIALSLFIGMTSTAPANAGERMYLARLVGDTGNMYHYRPVVIYRRKPRVYHRKRHVRRKHHVRRIQRPSEPYIYRSSVQPSGYLYHPSTSRMTDEKRIQKAMQGLGFYTGVINGDLNTYASRMAIKKTNAYFGQGSIPIMDRFTRENLVFLGTLFLHDETLVSAKANRTRQIQTALTILGFYQGNIDGMNGYATKDAIRKYKASLGLSGVLLSNDEAYQLVKSAKEKIDKEIADVLSAMKQRNAPNKPVTVPPVEVQAQ